MKQMIVFALFIAGFWFPAGAQDMTALISQVKKKLDQVQDYVAQGTLKTDVSFIKAPAGKVTVYFKKPDKFKLKREGGISILPKGGVSVSLNTLVNTNDYLALDAGESTVDGIRTTIVKLLPTNENSDIVLSTLYIDEADLIRKAVTTTKENGTYEISLSYGRYIGFALPDKVIFSFNTKDYKLPKGVTLEFDGNDKPSDTAKLKNKKGKIEITYQSYTINKGVDDSVFR